jgi:hypothetical protein
LVISSNVEFLVQELLDISEQAPVIVKGGNLSEVIRKKNNEVIEKMLQENDKLKELESYRSQGFFVDSIFNDNDVNIDSVESSLVIVRIQKVKHRISVGTPFLSLGFNEASKSIAKIILEEAFRSIVPLRGRITQFIFPAKD